MKILPRISQSYHIKTRISLAIGTNGKPLAAIGKFPNANGKL